MVVILTDTAIEAFYDKLVKRNTPNAYIRLGVQGGACAGLKFVIQYEDGRPRERDIEFFFNGIRVLIDNKSIVYLDGCTLDWKSNLMEQGFVFINPKEKSRCGCGASFSV